MWARQLGEQIGVTIPNQAAEHYYLITEKIADLPPNLPVLEDPASYGYFREETGGLLVGLFEPVCAPWNVEGIPADFSFGEIPPDWERMGPYLEKAMHRVPVTLEAGIKKFFCGPESFTPDLRPIVGEAPELKNYFVAAGLNSIGILTGGGLGRVLANWIVTGDPGADVTGFNIDRLHPYQANPEYRRERTIESLGLVYKCHYPTMTPQTARGVKRSAVHDRLAAAGAYFRDVSGWEGADWYAPAGHEPKVEKLSWGRENWFPWWEAEHRAAREGVILMDMSFMSKFLVQGRDAGRVLNHISANNVDGASGIITYTQWLNERGLLEADLTVTKLDDERFFVVVTDTMHRHAETWMRRHIARGCARLRHGRHLGLLPAQCARAEVARAAADADQRRSFERGVSVPHRARDRHRLCARAVHPHHLRRRAGLRALHPEPSRRRMSTTGSSRPASRSACAMPDLRRLPACAWKRAIATTATTSTTPTTPSRPASASPSTSRSSDFIGREAALKQKAAPMNRRLAQVLVKDPEPLLFHAEIVLRDGKPVGYVRAGSYGHTLGRRRGPRHDRGGRAARRRRG